MAKKTLPPFLPGSTIIFDRGNDFEVLNQALQNCDRLYCIDNQLDFQPAPLTEFEHKDVSAMRSYALRNTTSKRSASEIANTDMRSSSKGNKNKNPSESQNENCTDPNEKSNTNDNNQRYTAEKNPWHVQLGHTMPFKAVRNFIQDGTLLRVQYRKIDCK